MTSLAPGRVRVAHVGTSLSLNLFLFNQLCFLREHGFDVTAICDDDEWAVRLREAGIPIRPLGMGRRPHPLAIPRWAAALYRSLRTEPVDIVHTHNAIQAFVARLVARAAGVPLVLHTVHGWPFHAGQHPTKYRLYVALERLAGQVTDAVFFQNQDDLRLGLERGILPAGKVRFLGNGVDIDAFDRALAAADRAATRRSLGLADDEVAIAVIARLEPPKGHDFFLAGFRRLLDSLPRARALLVGYGLDEQRVRRLVHAHGLERSARILGYRRDVAAILRASDLFALTSIKEGLPRSVVEAMLAGVPVVATDVPGNRDVVAHGETGLLVGYGDVEGLAAALLQLASDRRLRERLVAAARQRAVQRYDERVVVARLVAFYRELLGRAAERGAPAPTEMVPP